MLHDAKKVGTWDLVTAHSDTHGARDQTQMEVSEKE